jgi:hypothetical protein
MKIGWKEEIVQLLDFKDDPSNRSAANKIYQSEVKSQEGLRLLKHYPIKLIPWKTELTTTIARIEAFIAIHR